MHKELADALLAYAIKYTLSAILELTTEQKEEDGGKEKWLVFGGWDEGAGELA